MLDVVNDGLREVVDEQTQTSNLKTEIGIFVKARLKTQIESRDAIENRTQGYEARRRAIIYRSSSLLIKVVLLAALNRDSMFVQEHPGFLGATIRIQELRTDTAYFWSGFQ